MRTLAISVATPGKLEFRARTHPSQRIPAFPSARLPGCVRSSEVAGHGTLGRGTPRLTHDLIPIPRNLLLTIEVACPIVPNLKGANGRTFLR